MGSVTPWGELIKQGFQNFRNGLNTLSSGMTQAGGIYGGGASFNPGMTQQQPLQNQQQQPNMTLSNIFKKNNTTPEYGAIGQEIDKQIGGQNLYDFIIQ